MSNENNLFFNHLFDILKHSGIEDSGCYYDIIKQNYDALFYIINKYNDKSTMTFKPENENGWGCCGKIIIYLEEVSEYGEYILELCCYGTPAINLYLDDIHMKMLVEKENIDVETEIQQINSKIAELIERKEFLLNSLKTNGLK